MGAEVGTTGSIAVKVPGIGKDEWGSVWEVRCGFPLRLCRVRQVTTKLSGLRTRTAACRNASLG